MDLDRRDPDTFDGVGYRDARMRVCRGVENDPVDPVKIRPLYCVDKVSFVV